MDIITDIDKLSERAEEINIKKERPLLNEIVLAIKEKIRELELTGLSAPQIGYNKRVFCLNFNGDIRTLINPVILNAEGIDLGREKCSSLPDKTYLRPRATKITVAFQTPMNKVEQCELIGLAAKVCQHQVDHLDGILLSDIGLEIDGQFERATDENKAAIIKLYLDSLDMQAKQLDEEVESDEDAKQIKQAAEFMRSVQTGETKLTAVPMDLSDEIKGKIKEKQADDSTD